MVVDELWNKVTLKGICFYLLDLKQAECFVLGKDLSGLVSILVNRKPIGIEPKLFGHLWEK